MKINLMLAYNFCRWGLILILFKWVFLIEFILQINIYFEIADDIWTRNSWRLFQFGFLLFCSSDIENAATFHFKDTIIEFKSPCLNFASLSYSCIFLSKCSSISWNSNSSSWEYFSVEICILSSESYNQSVAHILHVANPEINNNYDNTLAR